MSWYVKGGSEYADDDNPSIWAYVDIDGFPTGDFENRKWSDIAEKDPFFWFGNSGTKASPEERFEVGLYDNYRLSFRSSGIFGWHEASGEWYNMFSGAGGGGGDDLGNHKATQDLDMSNYSILNCMNHLTGATYKDLDDWFNVVESAAVISGGTITDNGDGTITVAAGKGIIKSADTEVAPSFFFDWAEDSSVSLTDDSLNYIYIDYNGGNPIISATTNLSSIDHRTKMCIGRVYREDTTLNIMNTCITTTEISLNICRRLTEVYGFDRSSGMITSETGTRNIAITAGVFYYGLNRYTTEAFDSSGTDEFIYLYRDGGGGWTKVIGQTQIDNTHYDDNSGTLATLTANRYGVHWVYMLEDGTVYVVYGQGDYKLAEALAVLSPNSLPVYITEIGMLIAKIIIQKNSSSFYDIIIPFETGVEFAPATDHGGLAGLGDDDHTQYLLANGSRGLTSNWNAGNYTITASNFAIHDNGVNEGLMGPSNAWGFHHPTTSQGGYDAVEIKIDDPFQIRYGSTKIIEIDTSGNITTVGNVDGVDVSALKSDVDGFPNELKNLVTAEIQQLENIGSTTISSTQWGYLGSLDQSLSTSDSPSFNTLSLDTVPTDPGTTSKVNIGLGTSTVLRIYTDYGYVDIGPANTSWVHFKTDRPKFYFDKPIHSHGGFRCYNVGATITEFSTDGTLSGNSDSAVPTEKAVKTYVDNHFVATFNAGTNLSAGKLCYLDTNGRMSLADADSESSAKTLLAISLDSPTTGNPGRFLLKGYYTTSGLSTGSMYYVSTTAGAWTNTAPSGTGDIVRIIGYALSSTKLFFDPDKTYIEVT